MADEPDQPEETMEEVIGADGRYPLEAYAFLHEGLARAVKHVHGAEVSLGAQQHVSGQELCREMRDLAIERWGALARTVLAKWNVRKTIDFGNMVYLLIEHGFMRKTQEDSLEDFRDVFDFEEAFGSSNDFELKE